MTYIITYQRKLAEQLKTPDETNLPMATCKVDISASSLKEALHHFWFTKSPWTKLRNFDFKKQGAIKILDVEEKLDWDFYCASNYTTYAYGSAYNVSYGNVYSTFSGSAYNTTSSSAYTTLSDSAYSVSYSSACSVSYSSAYSTSNGTTGNW